MKQWVRSKQGKGALVPANGTIVDRKVGIQQIFSLLCRRLANLFVS